MDSFERLKQSKQLFDEGILTEEEYEKLRKQLLAEISGEKKASTASQSTTETVSNTATSQSATTNTTQRPAPAVTNVISEEGATTGMKVLSFLIPLVGLILFLVNQNTKPVEAKDELKWAAIGFGVGVLCYVLLVGCGAAAYY